MNIGEFSKQSGLNPSKVRFYEECGLLNVRRKANGYRDYSTETLQTLKIILMAQQLGFTLRQIGTLLPFSDPKNWNVERLVFSLKGKLKEIGVLQKKLDQNKKQLQITIRELETRPAGLSCSTKAKRIVDGFQNRRYYPK